MWEDAIRVEEPPPRGVPRASERFDLLLEIGDLEFQKLGDRNARRRRPSRSRSRSGPTTASS
jgi:hypothetical protein